MYSSYTISSLLCTGVQTVFVDGTPRGSVWKYQKYKNPHTCGGTLVSCQHVLTSRHCVGAPLNLVPLGYDKDELVGPDQVRVGLGSTTDIHGYEKVPKPDRPAIYPVQ